MAGCAAHASERTTLPFYDTVDFTPHWTTTSAHRIGDFSLVTQTGSAITRADLDGRVHIATFMFTACPSLCPAVTANLMRVQKAIGGTTTRIVSYSVTPDTDTPASLAAFGRARHIDPAIWRLVTGDRDTIYRLARQSYFADDARVSSSPDAILHSEKVLLVDQAGHLRGVYNGTLPFDIERLIEDVRTLTLEKVGS